MMSYYGTIHPANNLGLYVWSVRSEVLSRLPRDWEQALAAVSKYYGWSRADAMSCTLSELRWWYRQLEKLEDHE